MRPIYTERTEYHRPLTGTAPSITLVSSYPKEGKCDGICGRTIHKTGPHAKCDACKAWTAARAKRKAAKGKPSA